MMDPSTIRPKFLPTHDDLGLVAVGFSGGQVSGVRRFDQQRY